VTEQRNRRLDRARAAGYLNVSGRGPDALERQYALWCWRLRLPVVCCERRSPRSKYGRVVLDLFTTAHSLSEEGKTELARLAVRLHIPARVTVFDGDAVWDDVPVRQLDALARSVFRAATSSGNYELRKPKPPAAVVKMFEEIRERVSLAKSA
jgi:hypothetical protein